MTTNPPAPDAVRELVEALRVARGYVEDNHDEGCDTDYEYGRGGQGTCDCGQAEDAALIDAALAKHGEKG